MSEYLADVERGNVIFSHIFFADSFEFRSSMTVTVFIRVGEGEVVWRDCDCGELEEEHIQC